MTDGESRTCLFTLDFLIASHLSLKYFCRILVLCVTLSLHLQYYIQLIMGQYDHWAMLSACLAACQVLGLVNLVVNLVVITQVVIGVGKGQA